nr:uncharacterized protein LOC123852061 [Mirounga angustirostris]
MAREEERDPERREAAARASGEEEEEEGEEGLSDSDDEDEDDEPGSGGEEEEEAAAAERERSEDARLQRAGLPPAAVPAAAARDRSGRRLPGPLPCRPRMPSPDDEDRERRRSRRRDLLLSQLCFLALVALLLWSLSSMQEHNDLDFMDLLGEDRQWTVGRKLMQVNDTLTSEDAGLRSSKNCTEPGNSHSCAVGSGCHFVGLWLRKSWTPCFPFEF